MKPEEMYLQYSVVVNCPWKLLLQVGSLAATLRQVRIKNVLTGQEETLEARPSTLSYLGFGCLLSLGEVRLAGPGKKSTHSFAAAALETIASSINIGQSFSRRPVLLVALRISSCPSRCQRRKQSLRSENVT